MTCAESRFRQFQERKAQNDDSLATKHIWRRCDEAGIVVAYHLGGRLGMECDRRWLGGILAQSSLRKSKPRKCPDNLSLDMWSG